MDKLPLEIIGLISNSIGSYVDINSARSINKFFNKVITIKKIKILYLNKLLDSKKKNNKFNKRLRCISSGITSEIRENNISYLCHGMPLEGIIFYYPSNLESVYPTKLTDQLLNILICKKIFIDRISPSQTKFISPNSINEILSLSDKRLKPENCEYGKCILRYIPYCRHCIQKWKLIDNNCKFIIKI